MRRPWILLFLSTLSVSAVTITTTYDEALQFFNNKPAKVVFIDPDASPPELYFIDFSVEPLSAKKITGNVAGGANIQISPDGTRVAFHSKNETCYVALVEENTTTVNEICAGYISPHWWIDPATGKEYLLVQRGEAPGPGNGIFSIELDQNSTPVGDPVLLVDQPMANAGRSADGRFIANNDEEHEVCHYGHGIFEIEPAGATSGATILHWIYVTSPNWYNGGNPSYGGYCNGAMCPSGPDGSWYGAAVHMGSGHDEIFIRLPRNIDDLPLVPNGDRDDCDEEVRKYDAYPEVYIDKPSVLGISNHAKWGYSDWTTHNDYLTATTGGSKSSKGNKAGWFINVARSKEDPRFALQFSSDKTAQPDGWVSDEGVSVGLLKPRNDELFGFGESVEFEAVVAISDGSVEKVEFLAGETLVATLTSKPYQTTWNNPPVGDYEIIARATDNTGTLWESAPRRIQVVEEAVSSKVVLTQSSLVAAPEGSGQFEATVYDQYDRLVDPQPTISWSIESGCTIDQQGSFTAGSEEGVFVVTASVDAAGGTISARGTVVVTTVSIKINFQEGGTEIDPDFLVDNGLPFGDRGNGYRYGWDIDVTDMARNRGNKVLKSLIHVQTDGDPYTWELELDNGAYSVAVYAGDPDYYHEHCITVEGNEFIKAINTKENWYLFKRETVNVTDGKLTISANCPHSKILAVHVDKIAVSSEDGIEVLNDFTDMTYAIGDTVLVEWIAAPDAVANGITVEVTLDAGVTYHYIQEGEKLNSSVSSLKWVIPASIQSTSCITDKAAIRICEYDGACATAKGLFNITDQSAVSLSDGRTIKRPHVRLERGRIRIRADKRYSEVRLMNASGKVLDSKSLYSDTETVLRLDRIPAGVLFLSFKGVEGKSRVRRIVVNGK